MAKSDPLVSWTHISTVRKPLIAAVSGFAIGGGFKLVEFRFAYDSARLDVYCYEFYQYVFETTRACIPTIC